MKSIIKIAALVLFSLTSANAQKGAIKSPVSKSTFAVDGIFAEFDTNKGKIVIQLEYVKTPITVANFISLAEGKNTFVKTELKGKPYYNGLKFHRVIKDFMVQGGCPLGTGTGDPGYKFKDEFTDLKHSKGGILSMANSGPGTNGSQFFITHKDTPWLDGKHTVFGTVISGMDVVNKIEMNDVINKVTIIKNGAGAKAFDGAKVFSNYYAGKGDDDKKQAAIEAEKKANQMAIEGEKMKEYNVKFAPVKAAKMTTLNTTKATSTKTASGLQYKITQNGSGKKPVEGTTIYVHYAGYFEDGSLFDSSYEAINTEFGKYDENRAKANGYNPFPFQYGNKGGLIPGFLEGINLMNLGDKAVFFIPSNLGYGERGYGNAIPANANLIFELEILEAIPAKK